MKNKKFINEIFFIRAIACLSVVLVHSITVTIGKYSLPVLTVDVFRALQMLLMYATPTLILISEFLLAYSYPSKTPKGFLWKRVKFILVPYIMMGTVYTIYSIINSNLAISNFGEEWISTVLKGQWHGYFVIIIFQFYILHMLFARYLDRFSPKIILPITFLINAFYLGYFNFVEPIGATAYYIWYDFSRLPFLGWIFYFALAYYCGRNLDSFRAKVNKNIIVIIGAAILLGAATVVSYHTGFINMIWSNRVDVLLYTAVLMFALFYIGSKFKKMPGFIFTISKYSFGIYLLHPLFHKILVRISYELPYINMGIFLLAAFVAGVLGSILLTYLLNKIGIGKFFVGKLGVAPKRKKKDLASEAA